MEIDEHQNSANSNDTESPLDQEARTEQGSSDVVPSISNASAQTRQDFENETDICRVCRSEAAADRPLFYPCVCTGSIKYIHQECLVQWLKYSKKEYCELCKHKFTFAPIYHPDMPKRLPVRDIITGLLKNIFLAIKFWLHSTLVALSWLAIVPLTACRIYRCLFAGSVSSLLTLPLDMLSTENILVDIVQGGFVVLCSLAAFISLVWLREQILTGGGPDWLENVQANPIIVNNNVNNMNNADNAAGAVNNPNAGRHGFGQPMAEMNNLFDFDDALEDAMDVPDDDEDEDMGPGGDDMFDDGLPQNDDGDNEDGVDADNAAEGANEENQEQGQQAANDDNHWNPMEWDRAAEDLTWDRLLGLDGSLLFLEHVFWVISLNTLFILVFAFCPYHLGHYMIYGLKIQEFIDKTHFDGLITTLVGYALLAVMFIVLYASMAISTFHRARKLVGLCYIVIKVALLVVIEICLFPLVCGIWLDMCSLKLFNATLSERMQSFDNAPGTSVFIHWLIGMIYVFYFATFVFLLREVLRPGILWFLRNLNDPDFNPVQEMIQLPVIKHVRRFLTSVTLFGFSIVLLLLLPIKIVLYLSSMTAWPTLPYNVATTSEALTSELSVELLWLHVVLPALLEQSHIRVWAKNLIKLWAVAVSWLLGLRPFLLGEPLKENGNNVNNANNNNNNNNNANNNDEPVNPNNGQVQQQQQQQPAAPEPNIFQFNVGVAHQALLQHNTPYVHEPYTKPAYFKARIVGLVLLICLSMLLSSISVLVIPVTIGRLILHALTGSSKLNEFYTIIVGLYSIWITIRLSIVAYNWLQIGLFELFMRVKRRSMAVIKSTLAIIMIFGLIPLPFGLLFQQVVIAPISSNHDQTPVVSMFQVWALGALLAKISTAFILTGPQWWLREAIDTICQDGFRQVNLKFIFTKVFYPVMVTLGLTLAIPCIIARSFAPMFTDDENTLVLIERRIYPMFLFSFSLLGLFIFQVKQFKRLYERIRNDKYLVGQRLINFERNLNKTDSN